MPDKIHDSTITDNGESPVSIGYAIGNPPRGKTRPLNSEVAKAIDNAREQRQRYEYAMQEAGRTHESNQARYKQRILDAMPIQNGVQRIPQTWKEYTKRLTSVYREMVAEPLFDIDDWRIADSQAQQTLKGNQEVVITAYASEMRRRIAAGQTNLKAMWQEIAHHADRDDAQLKSGIWQELKQQGGITPPIGI